MRNFPKLDTRTSVDCKASLARTIHRLSAAAPESSGRTALRSFGLLDVLHEYACGGLGRDALSGRHFRRFATIPYE